MPTVPRKRPRGSWNWNTACGHSLRARSCHPAKAQQRGPDGARRAFRSMDGGGWVASPRKNRLQSQKRPMPARTSLSQAHPCAALAALYVAVALAAAWMLELFAGAPPCHLCSLARIPYYLALLPAATVLLISTRRPSGPLMHACLGLIVIAMAASAAISLYHAGIQWNLWVGPDRCSVTNDILSATTADLIEQLQTTQLPRCQEPGFSVFGISLAAWNVLFSSVAALLAWQSRRAAASTPLTP